MKAVEAVVQGGKLRLEKPLRYPDGTKALVTFLTGPSNQEDATKWLAKYYEKTKDHILDEQFEKNVKSASEFINSWPLPE